MKIKNEKDIFDLYVKKVAALRSVMKEPFIQENDGRVWATEGHIVIMVNQKCVSGEYKTNNIGSDLPTRDYNCDFPLSISDLQDAIDRCPKEDEVIITKKEVKCTECDGYGEVDADYHAESNGKYYTISGTCPICDGEGTIEKEEREPTGNMIPKENSNIELGKGIFRWYRIRTIIKTCKMLDIKQIRLVRTHETEMSILELSKDIHIALMPMYVSDIEGVEIKKRAIRVNKNGNN